MKSQKRWKSFSYNGSEGSDQKVHGRCCSLCGNPVHPPVHDRPPVETHGVDEAVGSVDGPAVPQPGGIQLARGRDEPHRRAVAERDAEVQGEARPLQQVPDGRAVRAGRGGPAGRR